MSAASRTAPTKPVEPFTIGDQAQENQAQNPEGATAGGPAPGIPPELAQANQERDGLQAELEATKQQQAMKDESASREVAVETAIRPIQRQNENQMARVTKLRERIKGRTPKPRAGIFKLAALLEKGAASKSPYEPKDFDKAPLKPIAPTTGPGAQGIPYPLQRTQTTPIVPPKQTYQATPAQIAAGYPKQVGPQTTYLPPSVMTQADSRDPFEYSSVQDPDVRNIMYSRAQSQLDQERFKEPPAWYNVPAHFNNLMDDITGFDDQMRVHGQLLDPADPNAVENARAEMEALNTPDTNAGYMENAMGNLFGDDFSPLSNLADRNYDRSMEDIRRRKEEAGIDPDTQTLMDLIYGGGAKLNRVMQTPVTWGVDALLNGGRRGAEQLFGGAATAEDLGEQYNAGGGGWDGMMNLETDTLKDYARNRLGLFTGLGDTDREQTANQIAEANMAAQQPAEEQETMSAEARPVQEGPADFQELMSAIMPFLGMGNSVGGWDGYGSQRPDMSNQFINLMRALGGQQQTG